MKQLLLFPAILSGILFSGTGVSSQEEIAIEGLYATSTDFGYSTCGPHLLFDGSKATSWKAMPGAAIDEGVMIYFETPVKFGSVSAEAPSSADISIPRSLRIYTDGADLGSYKPSEKAIIDKKIRSIFIRIESADGITEKDTKSDSDGFEKKIVRYSGKSAGLSEIIFFDTAGKPVRVIPPRLIKGSVQASSTLAPEEAYHTGYLFDSRKDSGWVEGAKDSGTGESLTFSFESSVSISKLKIWNGLLISDVHYKANERVKSFTFAGNKEYSIPDSMSPQTIPLEKTISGNEFKFQIKSIYPGKSYKDTVISDIKFADSKGWFTLYTDDIERRKKETLRKTKGTPLENVVDHYIGEKQYNGMSLKFKSLLLRSDSSFVIWIEDEDTGSGTSLRKTKVLDGFWNVIKSGKDSVTVNIMGRNFNLSEQYNAYSGNKTSEAVSIFQDTLTISKNGVKGAKFFGSISL